MSINRSIIRTLLVLLVFNGVILQSCSKKSALNSEYDVVIYGGTSAGVIAAIQATKLGKRALLIESGTHLDGLTSGGLGATDIGNKIAIGGLSREFYQRVNRHYNPDSDTLDAMWTFEPHVAEKIFKEWIVDAGVEVIYKERLDLINGVNKIKGLSQTIL